MLESEHASIMAKNFVACGCSMEQAVAVEFAFDGGFKRFDGRGSSLGELPGRRAGERDGAQCGKLRSAQRQWLGIKAARILSPNTPTHA